MEEENEVFEPEILDDSDIFEEIKNRRTRSDVKISDIVTMQCIMCIVLAILAISLNLLLPKFSVQIIEQYKAESTAPSEVNDTLVAIVSQISNLMNATPNDRV